MVISRFPPLEEADEDGLLAVGGDLQVESLLTAYRNGIFPWPIAPRLLAWFAPPHRAIINVADFHLARSLQRASLRNRFSFTIDRSFAEVISGCAHARNRRGQRGTWITPPMIEAYVALHQAGYAHSIEAWVDGHLAGGLYGVAIGGMFAAESMYYSVPNASKLCLHYLVEHLMLQGLTWFDVQVINPTTAAHGAIEIPRDEFMRRLTVALADPIVLFKAKPLAPP